MMRYIFIGAIEFSAYCLEALLGAGVNITGVFCPYRDAAVINNDYFDLGYIAKKFGKEVYYFNKVGDEADRIKTLDPDVILVLGLSQIIPSSILKVPKLGCIGSHPAMLPRNRGRHPIVWAIANGLRESGVTLFWLNEGIDTGDIWAQKAFGIEDTDDASTVYEKVKKISCELLEKGLPELEKGIVTRVSQDPVRSNYLRKRIAKDGEIDWRMSSDRICNLVRALSRPYVGAHCRYGVRDVKIWKVKIVKDVEELVFFEPGKILSVNDGIIEVKTGDGAVRLVEHDFYEMPEPGGYL